MRIVVTGSLGRIGRPLTEELLKKGHEVVVVSSSPKRMDEIVSLGATAAIGSMKNNDFLTSTFKDADAVHCMIPPANYRDQNLDLTAHVLNISNNYVKAIQQSGVKRLVFLSSIGAHLSEGNGIIQVYHKVEGIFDKSLTDVSITFVRPTSFYYNLLGYIGMVKQGFIAANYGEEKITWVSPNDIANAIADEIVTAHTVRNIRYVASDERTGAETARVLGAAIGNPDLKWKIITDEESKRGLEAAGIQPAIAAGLVEMYSSMRSGKFWDDYRRNKPEKMGRVKLEDYAKDFAKAYNGGM